MVERPMKNSILIPVSIVVAGIIIAVAVVYKQSEKSLYLELANDIGLNREQFKTCVEDRVYRTEIEKDYADGVAAGVTATPTTFIGGVAIRGAYPYENYKEAIEAALSGAKILPHDPTIIWPTVDDDAVLGDLSAPVTMIVFGDFECPYCSQAFKTSEAQIRKEYVETGKVKMIYRDFPIAGHLSAIPAAEAAGCAHEQGKYWEYHDALFENQDRL